MGILASEDGERRCTLGARHLVGRSPLCALRLPSARVSSEHAALYWDEGRWWVKDLGSRNGTFVEGRRVPSGTPIPLASGARLELGDPSNRWTLSHAGPPRALALAESPGVTDVVEEEGVLSLPPGEAPEVVVHRTDTGGWALDDGESAREVSDLDLVHVGGQSWRLSLPGERERTETTGELALRLPDVHLDFGVSLDEEHVTLRVSGPRQDLDLRPRAHLYTLLVLARARLADKELPDSEQGWVDRAELGRMLAMSRNAVNTMLHRCRKQLAGAGVSGIEHLVERRSSSLRLGVPSLSVHTLGDAP